MWIGGVGAAYAFSGFGRASRSTQVPRRNEVHVTFSRTITTVGQIAGTFLRVAAWCIERLGRMDHRALTIADVIGALRTVIRSECTCRSKCVGRTARVYARAALRLVTGADRGTADRIARTDVQVAMALAVACIRRVAHPLRSSSTTSRSCRAWVLEGHAVLADKVHACIWGCNDCPVGEGNFHALAIVANGFLAGLVVADALDADFALLALVEDAVATESTDIRAHQAFRRDAARRIARFAWLDDVVAAAGSDRLVCTTAVFTDRVGTSRSWRARKTVAAADPARTTIRVVATTVRPAGIDRTEQSVVARTAVCTAIFKRRTDRGVFTATAGSAYVICAGVAVVTGEAIGTANHTLRAPRCSIAATVRSAGIHGAGKAIFAGSAVGAAGLTG